MKKINNLLPKSKRKIPKILVQTNQGKFFWPFYKYFCVLLRKLKIREVEKNVSINSDYYMKYVLTAIFNEDYFTHSKFILFHRDKATRSTSKYIAIFFLKVKIYHLNESHPSHLRCL